MLADTEMSHSSECCHLNVGNPHPQIHVSKPGLHCDDVKGSRPLEVNGVGAGP